MTTDQLKVRLERLRAEASRVSMVSMAQIFYLTNPIMDAIAHGEVTGTAEPEPEDEA